MTQSWPEKQAKSFSSDSNGYFSVAKWNTWSQPNRAALQFYLQKDTQKQAAAEGGAFGDVFDDVQGF